MECGVAARLECASLRLVDDSRVLVIEFWGHNCVRRYSARRTAARDVGICASESRRPYGVSFMSSSESRTCYDTTTFNSSTILV